MGLKKNFKDQVKRLEQKARKKSPEKRDTSDIINLPVPVVPRIEPNLELTPSEKMSIAKRGNSNRMVHGIFSKKAPSMTCDNCYLVRAVQDENYNVDPMDVKCPYYKVGHACIYAAVSLESNVRDIHDIKTLMEETVEMDMQRLQMARAIEVYDGGGVLDQALDMGMERIVRNMDMLKNLYLDINDMKKPREKTSGILSQLLGELGARKVEEAEVVQ